jgi:hypothetical protein
MGLEEGIIQVCMECFLHTASDWAETPIISDGGRHFLSD